MEPNSNSIREINKPQKINKNASSESKSSAKKDLITLNKLKKWTRNVEQRIKRNSNLNLFEKKEVNPCLKNTNSNSNQVSKMVQRITKQQMEANGNDEQNSQKEKNYEIMYPKKFYDVLIFGDNLSDFPTFYNRIDEIKRCVGVNPEMVLPIFNKLSQIVKYKVRVKNYNDYRNLLGEWPKDAFKTGVIIQTLPKNLKVVIQNVKKQLKVGILKTGANFENDPKIYPVLPNIVNYKLCQKCGRLNHQERNCTSHQRCLRCSEYGHSMEQCHNTSKKCINCLARHECFSEKCRKFVNKKVNINWYALKILEGENFIGSFSDILTTESSFDTDSAFKKQNSLIKQVADQLINTKLEPLSDKLESLDQIFKFQSDSLSSIRKETTDLITSIKTTYENLNKYKVEISSVQKQMNDISE
ncbi:unnamed protein product, partial [Brachionus calyciflorus]